VILPKEPFVWGVSHIIPRPVPIHIPRPPYIKGDSPMLNDSNHREAYGDDVRIALGSSDEVSLRKAALLARDALNYASTLAKVAI
jgi:methionyl aminopeptidase